MNGGQDLGGMDGFGPINPEVDEPVFHAEWERRVFALTLAMGAHGAWNIDQSRHARESMDPGGYLSSSYYQIWLHGLETLLEQSGFVSPAELDQREAPIATQRGVTAVLRAEQVPQVLRSGNSAKRDASGDQAELARFQIDDRVRVRNEHPPGHTRSPRYVRGRLGVIAQVHGFFVFPDSHAASGDPAPQMLYNVEFSARELWGQQAPSSDRVRVDLWDSYLEAS